MPHATCHIPFVHNFGTVPIGETTSVIETQELLFQLLPHSQDRIHPCWIALCTSGASRHCHYQRDRYQSLTLTRSFIFNVLCHTKQERQSRGRFVGRLPTVSVRAARELESDGHAMVEVDVYALHMLLVQYVATYGK
jgi:hypothetical protein